MSQQPEASLEFVFRVDLARWTAATWQAHRSLAAQLPVQEIDIYSAGFQAALRALSTAYGLNVPVLRDTAPVPVTPPGPLIYPMRDE